LDEATIAILEDEMDYREKLAARERERGNSGSGMERMNWLGFMREDMERRGISQ